MTYNEDLHHRRLVQYESIGKNQSNGDSCAVATPTSAEFSFMSANSYFSEQNQLTQLHITTLRQKVEAIEKIENLMKNNGWTINPHYTENPDNNLPTEIVDFFLNKGNQDEPENLEIYNELKKQFDGPRGLKATMFLSGIFKGLTSDRSNFESLIEISQLVQAKNIFFDFYEAIEDPTGLKEKIFKLCENNNTRIAVAADGVSNCLSDTLSSNVVVISFLQYLIQKFSENQEKITPEGLKTFDQNLSKVIYSFNKLLGYQNGLQSTFACGVRKLSNSDEADDTYFGLSRNDTIGFRYDSVKEKFTALTIPKQLINRLTKHKADKENNNSFLRLFIPSDIKQQLGHNISFEEPLSFNGKIRKKDSIVLTTDWWLDCVEFLPKVLLAKIDSEFQKRAEAANKEELDSLVKEFVGKLFGAVMSYGKNDEGFSLKKVLDHFGHTTKKDGVQEFDDSTFVII